MQYPCSPKLMLGGLAHLPRLIDKIRLRHRGEIPDYNYLTVGFDKYLLDLLQIDAQDLERRVLEGGTDMELLGWVQARARPLSEEDVRQWNDRIFRGGPKDAASQQRFDARLAEIAAKRRMPLSSLPTVAAWSDIIELDEGRM
jgi:uncharacterized protein DUF5069